MGRGRATVEKEGRLLRLSQVNTDHITTTVTRKSRQIRGLISGLRPEWAKNRLRAYAWAHRLKPALHELT
jgi:hypothetical protein